MNKKKVLLVDNVDYYIDMKKRLIKRENCDVVTASDGNMALELTIKERPDLVLMDRLLPGMSGEECCRAIKEDPSLKDIPVILIIVKGQEEEIRNCLKAGCDDYITKPLNNLELIKKLQQHLNVVVREHIRIPMSISASYTHNGEEYSCKVHDVSEGGMFIITEKPLSVKSSILLKFVVPSSDIAILALGEVMRIVEDLPSSTGKPRPGYGIKFLKMPNVGKQVIAKVAASSTPHITG